MYSLQMHIYNGPRTPIFFFSTLNQGKFKKNNSKSNLMEWMDRIITAIATDRVLVKDSSGRRIDGFYHMLKQDEHSRIESQISHYRTWQT